MISTCNKHQFANKQRQLRQIRDHHWKRLEETYQSTSWTFHRSVIWRIIKNKSAERDNRKVQDVLWCVFLRRFQWWSRILSGPLGWLANWFSVLVWSIDNPAVMPIIPMLSFFRDLVFSLDAMRWHTLYQCAYGQWGNKHCWCLLVFWLHGQWGFQRPCMGIEIAYSNHSMCKWFWF